ncbi:MAG: response regulator [Chitinophagaceae bacterium]
MEISGHKGLILYADDDPDDLMLLQDTLQAVAPNIVVETVSNGREAIDYLTTQTPPMPCLVILDLNMPGMNGKEVMECLKKGQEFCNIPMVVFTTSSNPTDRDACARFGVDMITKPIDLYGFEKAASKLLSYCI